MWPTPWPTRTKTPLGYRLRSRALPNPERAGQRRQAQETITVVIGNPPYKEKAKGMGGWVEDRGAGCAPRSTIGSRRPNGASARTPNTCATSMSISGAGQHGRSSAVIRIAAGPTRARRNGQNGEASSASSGTTDFERSGLSEDARRLATGVGQDLRGGLRAGRPSTAHQQQIFQAVQQPVCIVLALRQ